MALTITVTDAGRAALVNAANNGTAPVTIAQVGLSGTAVVPSKTATALPGEFKRLGTISGGVVADDTIHVIVRDESTDVFTVRSLCLYLADGTLFAIYGQADVLAEKSGQAMLLIAVDVKFEDIDATTLTFGNANFLNPPATTTTMGVVELSTGAEAIAGTSSTRVPPEKAIKDAVFAWLDLRFGANNSGIWHPGNDGAGSGLDADLLDGQQGSYYLSAATYTAANILAKLLTVDGAGSALDADLLDSQHGSYYRDLTNSTGILPNANFSGSYDGITSFSTTYLRASATQPATLTSANHAFTVGNDTGSNLAFSVARIQARNNGAAADLLLQHSGGDVLINGNIAFHAGNDGAGSGMDSDLLDGQHGAYYRDLANSTGTIPNARLSGQYTGIFINTLTNQFWLQNSQYGFQLGNSDIIGVNGIFFSSDVSNADGEGLNFLKSGASAHSTNAGDYDMLRGPGNGTLLWNGDQIFHAGNDGSGSGMDSDLLDGQHGSYYQNLANSTGTLPNARLSGTYDGLTELGSARIRLTSTTNASLSSTTHAFQIGVDTGENLIADINELQARKNGEASSLLLNKSGGDVLIGSSLAWHAGNDGSGSGQDADLLDGQHGTYYRDLTNSTGTLPNARLAGAYTGITVETVPNSTWAASGAYGLNLRNSDILGANGIFFSNDTSNINEEGLNFLKSGAPAASQDTADYDNLRGPGNGTLLWNGDIVFNAGNDGSGSGMDADLLDGLHASAFVKLTDFTGSNQSIGTSGYQKLPGGMILQWGTITLNDDSYGTVTFPIAFPNACRSILSGCATEVGNGNAQANGPLPYSATKTGASFWNAAGGASAPYTAWWFAIGN